MRTARFSGRPYSGEGAVQGVSKGCVSSGCVSGGCLDPEADTLTAPVNRMTDRCKNITLPQTSFAGGNKKLRPEGLDLHRFISEVVQNFSQT